MNIVLDFSPRSAWDRMFTDREIAQLGETEVSLTALPADLIFIVNGTDLSWHAEIPMLDFARSFFFAVGALSPSNRREEFISPDLEPTWTVELESGSVVRISRRQGLDGSAACDLSALRLAIARFGIRVFETFVKAYPLALNNEFLKKWYPLEGMKLESIGLG